MECIFCECEIHPKRVELGYETCIKCSTEKKCGYIHLFEGKSANTIQVIKDPDKAAELQWCQTRKNHCVANGMYLSYR